MALLIWLKIIITYLYPLVFLLSLAFNFICLIIFSRKSFENTVFKVYFRCYVLFQTFNLIMPINKMLEFNFDVYFSQISNLTCKFRYYYGNVNYSTCSWLLVVVSLDRFLSISYPHKFIYRQKTYFQIIVCFFVIGLNACFYTSSFFYYLQMINETNNQTIKYKCIPNGIWIEIMKLLEQFIIPFILMILFTLLTAKNLYRSRKINSSFSNNKSTKSNCMDRKFTITSIIINILFLLFNLPYFLLFMINKLYLNNL